MRVGVVSDTHGRLRPRVLELLAGCDRILHAGDVGAIGILDGLSTVAPVLAVRGNVDYGPGLSELPTVLEGEIGGLTFRMVHRQEDVGRRWVKEVGLVVYGHSHRPELAWHGDTLLLNPGACGQRRFSVPLTLALLTVTDGRVVPEIRSVETPPAP